MNVMNITLLVSLILSSGIVGYIIGFGIGNRSAYHDVNTNLKNTDQGRFGN